MILKYCYVLNTILPGCFKISHYLQLVSNASLFNIYIQRQLTFPITVHYQISDAIHQRPSAILDFWNSNFLMIWTVSLGAVRGHPRSSVISPFDRAHTTSYSTLIETVSISFRDIDSTCRKSPILTHHAAFGAPFYGLTPVEFREDLRRQKTRDPGL